MVTSDSVLMVHIPKTGGMSCRAFLMATESGAAHVLLGESFPHIPLRDAPEITGRPLDSYEHIIAIVREPMDQQLSLWYHWRDGYARGGRHLLEITAAIYPQLTTWLMDPYSDPRYWYETHVHGDGGAERVFRSSFYPWFFEVDGSQPPNLHVVTFEDAPVRVPEITGNTDIGYPHINRSVKRDTLAYYTHVSADIVRGRFLWAYANHYSREPKELAV